MLTARATRRLGGAIVLLALGTGGPFRAEPLRAQAALETFEWIRLDGEACVPPDAGAAHRGRRIDSDPHEVPLRLASARVLSRAPAMPALIVTAALCAVLTSSAAGQRRFDVDTGYGWMNDLQAAVEAYRGGDIAAALKILDQRQPSELRALAPELLKVAARTFVHQSDETGYVARRWTPADVHVLAALEMEAALRVYLDRTDRTTFEDVWTYVRAAEPLFAFVAAVRPAAEDSLGRWKLVLGGTALAHGEFWWAAALLDRASRVHPADAGLLVACATAHEAIASLPAALLLAEGHTADDELRLGADSQQAARAARTRHLSAARAALESALQRQPHNTEALLRLGHLQSMRGNPEAAAALLEKVVSERPPRDVRAEYLARLFLGRVLLDLGRHDDAILSFRAAAAAVPAAQSAQVGLMQALLVSGAAREAAATAQRMNGATNRRNDPWWTYGHGEFWVLEPLLATLRLEARQ